MSAVVAARGANSFPRSIHRSVVIGAFYIRKDRRRFPTRPRSSVRRRERLPHWIPECYGPLRVYGAAREGRANRSGHISVHSVSNGLQGGAMIILGSILLVSSVGSAAQVPTPSAPQQSACGQ